MQDDLRKVSEKRTRTFTVKLTDQEAADLKQLADRHCRRPGDELRHLLHTATRNHHGDAVDGRRQPPTDPSEE